MEFTVENEIKLPDLVFDARYHPSNENNLFAAATIGGDVFIYESNTLKNKLKKLHKGSAIRKVRFTQDGRMVTIAKTVKVHDLSTNEPTITLQRNDDKKTTFYSVKPFGTSVITAGDDDGSLFLWDSRVPYQPVFSAHDCDQYISDIDGKYENRKLIVCTSGEGTLTAYDMRAKKMIEPQSEVFEAGFQCVKLIDINKKVVIGGEDGAIYVFNQNEWAHTSGKFAISDDTRNRGECSVDCIEVLNDETTFLIGCSDGRMRSLTLWPHQVLSQASFCRRSALESIHVNPNEGQSQLLLSGDCYLNVVSYKEKDDEEPEPMEVGADVDTKQAPANSSHINADDYLNVFN